MLRSILATALLLAALIGGTMTSTASADKARVTLGTATPGGGFPAYGAAVSAAIQEADPTLEIETLNTKGSTENVPLLEAGKLDLALVQGEVAMEAMEGIGRPRTNLLVLTAMYATPGMFVVKADSPYRTIDDLKGKRVAFGAKGSGLIILARFVLDGLGLDRDRDFDPVFLDRAGDGPAMVMSGEVAALWGAGTGWPGFTAVAKGPAGARFLVPDAAGIARIRAKHSFLKELVVPAGSFPGQNAPLQSVGSWSFIMARPSLDEGIAYRLARALKASEATLGERFSQARETTAANTIGATSPERLHPGVARYYREIGLLR